MRKLLAVMPETTRYGTYYTVTVAESFEHAKYLIQRGENLGMPFDDLDLPVYDEKEFRSFLEWMRSTGRNYPFSVFGCKDTVHFVKIRDEARAMGFHFNS